MNRSKASWAPVATSKGLFRVKAYAEFSFHGVSLFVTRSLGSRSKYTVTARNGMRFASVDRKTIQGTIETCKHYIEGFMRKGNFVSPLDGPGSQHTVTAEKLRHSASEEIKSQNFHEALTKAGDGRRFLSDEEVYSLPVLEETKKTVAPDLVTPVVVAEIGKEDFVIISDVLSKVVAKRGTAAGRLQRNPPVDMKEKALWAALQPNYFKVKDGCIMALMAQSGTDLGRVISRVHQVKWPVEFDYDADQLQKMGVFP